MRMPGERRKKVIRIGKNFTETYNRQTVKNLPSL
jgi:hypothetical protein